LPFLSRLKGSICLVENLKVSKEESPIKSQVKSDLQVLELYISNLIVLPKLRDKTLSLNISTFKLSHLLNNIPEIFKYDFVSKKILYNSKINDINSIIKIDYVILRQILLDVLIFFINESEKCSLELIITVV